MQETSNSEYGKPKKGKVVCYYFNKPNHGEDVCMKKKLAQCINILEKHNLKILDNIRNIKPIEKFEEPPDEDKRKDMGHTLIAATFSPIVDGYVGPSNMFWYIEATKEKWNKESLQS